MIFILDAPDFYNSKFFDTSSSGVGGWGDPANDFQISTGGLKGMVVAYPTPHHLRRNFTLFPFANPTFPPPWGDDPSAPPVPAELMMNTTMTQQNVDFILDTYEGDFFGFQTYFESIPVSLALSLLSFPFGCLTLSCVGASRGRSPNSRRVSTL